MLQAVKEAFHPEILKEALARFELPQTPSAKDLKGFESYVFECQKEEKAYILKLYHQAHRNPSQIAAEWHWVKFLHQEGLQVPCIYPSKQGLEIEVLPDGFFAVLSEKLPGRKWKKEQDMTATYFQTLGDLLGRLHAASCKYSEVHNNSIRPDWRDDELLSFERWLPEGDQALAEAGQEILEEVQGLIPKKSNFGLVHGDLHDGNLFITDKGLSLFDFDDCLFHWFVNDIAVAMFYLLPAIKPGVNDAQIEAYSFEILPNLLGQYQKHHCFSVEEVQYIPLFMRLRELTLYCLIHRVYKIDELSDRIKSALPFRRKLILSREFGCDWSQKIEKLKIF